MVILLIALFRSYFVAFIVGSLLGAVDEGIQYFYLNPDTMRYYDFNDLLLNQIGCLYGLILAGAWLDRSFPTATKERTGWIISGSVLLALIAGWAINLIDFHPGTFPPAPVRLIREPETGFWTILHPYVRFHVVRPWEGIALMLLITYGVRKLDTSFAERR